MGVVISVLLAALAILAAACAKVLADEFKAWAPTIVAKIIKTAVRTLPVELRERFSEEWLGHVDQTPGDATKIAVACGFLLAALNMANGPFGLRKRVLDLAVATFALAFFLPVFVLVALAIKMNSAGPILVRQPRIGREGKPFQALKFRTTRIDAASQRVELTAIGILLRSCSFVELPQLLNVFWGDMSLVGPRPLSEDDELHATDLYKTCRPGVTGLWAFGRQAKDLVSYTGNWSLKLDAKILLAGLGILVRDVAENEPEIAKWANHPRRRDKTASCEGNKADRG